MLLTAATTTTTTTTHATSLLQLLISSYFSQLSSVLIVHDTRNGSALKQQYLDAVQQSFRNQSQLGNVIGLQWIDVGLLLDDQAEFEQQMLRAVDVVTQGFITMLPNTLAFLHARYYATRNAQLRLKDKFYLFLCEQENPQDFLTAEILQFYPQHLMVVPATTTASTTILPTTTAITSPAVATPAPAKPTEAAATKITKSTLNKFLAPSEAPPPAQSSRTIWRPPESTHRDINFELWTQKFVGAVGNLEAVRLDAFLPNETFAQHVELYPNKVRDLKGRALRVGSITYIPYVVTNYVLAGSGNTDPINPQRANASVFYVGSEAEIVKTFCEVCNCHLLVEPFGVDNWGVIYENETSTGMLGDVYKQRVELAIGCIYNWYNDVTETSHTIARSAVTLLGPAPAQFPAWRTPIMPFTLELWSFLILTMLLCALVLYAIKLSTFYMKRFSSPIQTPNFLSKKCRFHHMKLIELCILDIIAVFIQQPSMPASLRRFAARIFMATLLCATITLENTYSGQLKSILTIPFYTEPVDTMDKWAQTDWHWAAPSIIWVQTIAESKLPNDQILTQKFQVRDYDYLYNASFRPDYGLGIERLMSGAFSFGDFITAAALDTKIVPKDDLYFDWTRAVSIRGWPLMPLFNKHVLTCMETGLFVHWERSIVAKYLDRQTQEIMLRLASGHQSSKMPPQKLTVLNVSGALFALLFGYVIATLTLLLELFGHNIKLKILLRQFSNE